MHRGTRIFCLVIFYAILSSSCGCNKSAKPVQTTDSTLVMSPLSVELKHSLPVILKESSGLCYTDGNLWTFGDSGNPNEIFKVDSSTGAILQTVVVDNFSNVDWEDITADSSYIYIGDIGNNGGDRKDLKIIRIKKTEINDSASVIHLNGDAINFSYSDQTDFTPASSTDFDCEALISIGDLLYLFTKDGVDLQTRCYKLPNQPGNYTITPMSTFNTKGKITAAAYNPDLKEIALLGYMNKKVESFIWFLDHYTGDDFFGGTAVKITIGSGSDWQTEGIDYISRDRLFLSCESSASQAASLYSVNKN